MPGLILQNSSSKAFGSLLQKLEEITFSISPFQGQRLVAVKDLWFCVQEHQQSNRENEAFRKREYDWFCCLEACIETE